MRLWPALFLLVACKPPIVEETGGPGETGETGTSAPEGLIYDWVMVELRVANATDGVDLDGDGTKDNALSTVDTAVTALLAGAVARAENAQVVQLGDVSSFEEDPDVIFAVFTVPDPDGAANNASGTANFDADGAVDEQGRASQSAPTAIYGGEYQVRIPGPGLVVGEVDLIATTDIYIAGFPQLATQELLVAFAISVDSLDRLGEFGDGAAAIADIDTDGDGIDDAVSAAFEVDTVACTVTP